MSLFRIRGYFSANALLLILEKKILADLDLSVDLIPPKKILGIFKSGFLFLRKKKKKKKKKSGIRKGNIRENG